MLNMARLHADGKNGTALLSVQRLPGGRVVGFRWSGGIGRATAPAARYGIVALIAGIPRCAPATSHPTPVRVMRGRDFRHTADDPAVSLPFRQGPAGTSAGLR